MARKSKEDLKKELKEELKKFLLNKSDLFIIKWNVVNIVKNLKKNYGKR